MKKSRKRTARFVKLDALILKEIKRLNLDIFSLAKFKLKANTKKIEKVYATTIPEKAHKRHYSRSWNLFSYSDRAQRPFNRLCNDGELIRMKIDNTVYYLLASGKEVTSEMVEKCIKDSKELIKKNKENTKRELNSMTTIQFKGRIKKKHIEVFMAHLRFGPYLKNVELV